MTITEKLKQAATETLHRRITPAIPAAIMRQQERHMAEWFRMECPLRAANICERFPKIFVYRCAPRPQT